MSAISDVLRALLKLPGATYSCIAVRTSGELLAAVGRDAVDPAVVVEWGRSAAAFLAAAATDDLDDLMITSHRSYRLIRQLHGGDRQPLLVYLCLDRARANLALARRELALVRLPDEMAGDGPPSEASAVAPVRSPVRPVAHRTMRSLAASVAVSPVAEPASGPESAPIRTAAPAPLPLPQRVPSPVPAPPPAMPLPRRPAARMPSPRQAEPADADPPHPPDPPPVVTQRWADDIGTMRRLLSALRALR